MKSFQKESGISYSAFFGFHVKLEKIRTRDYAFA